MRMRLLLGLLPVSVLLFGIAGIWRIIQPVQIDAVHTSNSYSNVLVRNFPLTDQGRINWWLKNRELLYSKYGIPEPDADGYFVVLFWAWDGVYRADRGAGEDFDLRCFEDMSSEAKCIVKSDIPLEVTHLREGGVIFEIGRGKRLYSQKESGGEPKRRLDWEEAEKEAWERSEELSRKLNE